MSRGIRRLYLASSWRNEYHGSVLKELIGEGFDVYDFKNPAPGKNGFGWSQVIDRPIQTAADLALALAHPRAHEGFRLDYEAMQVADACVLLLPCGNSAHLEAGWFSGCGKPVAVLIPELREPELMYKLFAPLAVAPLFSNTAAVSQYLRSGGMSL